jgi:hypothetical protein
MRTNACQALANTQALIAAQKASDDKNAELHGLQPNWTKGTEPNRPGTGSNNPTVSGDEEHPTKWGLNISTDMLSTENIFGGGSCPTFPSFTLMGKTVNLSDITYWCTLVQVMRGIILILAAFVSIKILLGGNL